ncbi:MAG: glutamine--fructose-6-phosphate transaminase (isomerizing) [Chloroflexi bacterium 44-23]|nr:MAG: glutamine--fructose-6-phosphate transaminase (isomerizing) [Chloroflexi bacterium 44-23]
MCGIFGIVTKHEKNLGNILTAAGQRLSYRGYDSVGVATIHADQSIDLRKDVGKVQAVAEKYNFSEMNGCRGILQLRWATFGEPSQVNAQPHLDSKGLMVGAHNGNIVNNVLLRKQFSAEGMLVRSTNDGESCVHAVERHLLQGNGMLDAIRLAYQDLEGDYAFVIASGTDEKLYAIKNGSGLIAAFGEDFTCISSDLPSILPLSHEIIFLNDGEIVELTPSSISIYSAETGEKIERQAEVVIETMEAAQKGGFAHFMLKEINEQPQVARELLHLWDRMGEVEQVITAIQQARSVYFIGCGTSYNACVSGAIFFNNLANRSVIPIAAPQFMAQYNQSTNSEDIAIFVSQSGETKDVLNAVDVARQNGMRIFSLVNVVGSTLTKKSEIWLPLACGYEVSVPATKTFTNQMVAFLFLAYRLAGKDSSVIHQLPQLMEEEIRQSMQKVVDFVPFFDGWKDFYCLGFGLTYPIALEGALKIKEITYAHCEGMLSTEFKHGPLAAVSDRYPVIFVSTKRDIPFIISGINEVTCRGGLAIAIGPQNAALTENAYHVLPIVETNDEFLSILAAIPLQLLSYQLSLRKGYDPDFPRNLSKTLTVD